MAPTVQVRIPTTLPVLVIQVELDPVGENLAGTRRLVERYRALAGPRRGRRLPPESASMRQAS